MDPQTVLRLEDIATPPVGRDEVLIKVHAASVNPFDWHVMRGEPYLLRLQAGLRSPKTTVLGSDVAGRIEVAGSGVTRFQAGDEVFGEIAGTRWGSFAEYACVPAVWLESKPPSVSFELAAALPLAGLTALQGLRDHGRVQADQKVMIVGASGGVGALAVQLARYFEAEVTGVCSTPNLDLVRSLGAHQVIDYTTTDFTSSADRYDLIFQLGGTVSASHYRRVLAPRGTLVLAGGAGGGRWLGALERTLGALALSPFVSQRLVSFIAKRNQKDLRLLKDLVEAGTISPIIDRTYTLDQVPDAIRYVETGHARGKVVITVHSSPS